MFTFQQLKRYLKRDAASLSVKKLALLGDTATQFLAIALRGMGVEHGYSRRNIIK